MGKYRMTESYGYSDSTPFESIRSKIDDEILNNKKTDAEQSEEIEQQSEKDQQHDEEIANLESSVAEVGEVAASAKEAAGEAKDAASAAQETANSAQSTAEAAQETANGAQEAADQAQEAAVAAQEVANDAQNAANAAQEAADAAQDAADAAQETANENAAAIEVLNGDGEGSVKKTVSDAIDEVVSGAPEAFDTLKEIADYLEEHGSEAADMMAAIEQNTEDIAKNAESISGIQEDLAAEVERATEKENELEAAIADKADASALEEVSNAVAAEAERAAEKEGELEAAVAEKANAADVDTALAEKADASALTEVSEAVAAEAERAAAKEAELEAAVAAKADASALTEVSEAVAAEAERAAAKEAELEAAVAEKVAQSDYDAKVEELEAKDAELEAAVATKTDKEINGANGKALMFNESDGGGAKFEHADGTWSFAGVNDGGENGIAGQIYAIKKNASDKFEGTRIDVTKGAMYYTVGDDAASARMVAENEIAVKGDVANAVADLASKEEVADAVLPYFDDAEYDSNEQKIVFKHGDEVKAEIDASDFIKDGMIESVVVENGNLVITFNTDSGKESINVPISDIFDADNYYTKGEVDNIVAPLAVKSAVDEQINTEVAALNDAIAEKVAQSEYDAKVAELEAAVATKTDKEINGANGKALMFNESDGGGAKFEHADGTWSFAGVNDGGENGIAGQIYAVKKNASNKMEGTRIDVTKGAMYYTVGDAAASARMVAENEIAVKGDIAEAVAPLATAADVNATFDSVNAAIDEKANADDVYSKDEVDAMFDGVLNDIAESAVIDGDDIILSGGEF